MRLSQNNEQKLQHFLDQFSLLDLTVFHKLLASCILDFLEDLRAKNELESSVDDGVDIFCVFLFASMVEKDVDDLEAEELEIEEIVIARFFFLLGDDPVDEGNEVIEPVG